MFKELNTLKVFFEDPEREFNVREYARLLKISPATASKSLQLMAKKSLLSVRRERMLILYKANLESELYRDLKIFYNLQKIKASGLINELNDFYLKPVIVLFGSCAYGFDVKESDCDMLIISEKVDDFPWIKKYEQKLKRKLQFFVVKSIKDLKNEHLINNILNGVNIQGKIKWI